MNNVCLVGRITKDVEIRYTQTGTAIVRFTLAVDRPKKDAGADFIRCTAFNATAELMDKYVSKGDCIGVEGHIRTGSYEKNGEKVYTTEVNVDRLEFLEPKRREQPTAPAPAPAQPKADGAVYRAAGVEFTEVYDDEDIPF